jgi:predicted ester cyclase
MIFKSFPDIHINIEDIIAEGDKVWIRNIITTTHIGELSGLAPKGKSFTEPSVWIYRIVDIKITEGWMFKMNWIFTRR